jgi:hypothetical protein
MKIENLDNARVLGSKRDTLHSMLRHLSKDNKDRRIRIQAHYEPDDTWDDVSADDRLLELVEKAISARLEEIEQEILKIE